MGSASPFKLFSDVTICCRAKLADFICPFNSCSAIFLSNRCVLLPTQSHYLVKEMLNKIKTPPFTLLQPSSFRFILRIFPPTCHLPIFCPPPTRTHHLLCLHSVCLSREAPVYPRQRCVRLTPLLSLWRKYRGSHASRSSPQTQTGWRGAFFCINHGIWL